MNSSNPKLQNGTACNCINLLLWITMISGASEGWKIGLTHHWTWAIVGIFVGGVLGFAAGLACFLLLMMLFALGEKFDKWRDQKNIWCP